MISRVMDDILGAEVFLITSVTRFRFRKPLGKARERMSCAQEMIHPEKSTTWVGTVERQIAESIIGCLGSDAALDREDESTFRFRIPGGNWKVRIVIFSKESLRRLAGDPQREVKIEYLQRDLKRIASARSYYTYPHALSNSGAGNGGSHD